MELELVFTFEQLDVYQKSIDLADDVCKLTEQFSNGRFTKPDRKNFFGIARGSVQECVPLLELARRRAFVDRFSFCSKVSLQCFYRLYRADQQNFDPSRCLYTNCGHGVTKFERGGP